MVIISARTKHKHKHKQAGYSFTMLTIHYFASIREALDTDSEQLALPESVSNINDLIVYLGTNNPAFQSLSAADNKMLVAVNQTVVDKSYRLSENDEVAFFPPMTGG